MGWKIEKSNGLNGPVKYRLVTDQDEAKFEFRRIGGGLAIMEGKKAGGLVVAGETDQGEWVVLANGKAHDPHGLAELMSEAMRTHHMDLVYNRAEYEVISEIFHSMAYRDNIALPGILLGPKLSDDRHGLMLLSSRLRATKDGDRARGISIMPGNPAVKEALGWVNKPQEVTLAEMGAGNLPILKALCLLALSWSAWPWVDTAKEDEVIDIVRDPMVGF